MNKIFDTPPVRTPTQVWNQCWSMIDSDSYDDLGFLDFASRSLEKISSLLLWISVVHIWDWTKQCYTRFGIPTSSWWIMASPTSITYIFKCPHVLRNGISRGLLRLVSKIELEGSLGGLQESAFFFSTVESSWNCEYFLSTCELGLNPGRLVWSKRITVSVSLQG